MDKDKNSPQFERAQEAPNSPKLPRGLAATYVGVFVALLIIPTIIWGALMIACRFSPELYEKISPPTNESLGMAGKDYAEFPTTFNIKTYTAEIENWYNDHLPFRSVIFNSYGDIKSTVEKPYESTIRPALVVLLHGNEQGGGNEPEETIIDILGDTTQPPDETETLPSFDNDETSPTDCEHVYDEGVMEIEPTCSDWGVAKYTCTLCSHVRREYTAKEPHDYAVISDNSEIVTCGTKYERYLKCKNCEHESLESGVKQHKNGKKLKRVQPSYASYGYTLVSCEYCGGEYRTDIKPKLYDTSFALENERSSDVIEGRYQWLYYRGNNYAGYYQGTNLLTETELAYYTSILVQLDEICKSKGITLQISIWPNKAQVYPEYYPSVPVETEYKRVERLVDYIHENSDVKIIYPLKELTAAKPYWDVYYKHDTHWNYAGGYIGYQAMMASLGLQTANLYNLPVFARDRFGGDLISLGNLNPKEYTGDSDYTISYLPEVEIDSYIGADGANDIRHTTASNATHDCNFVMLADSYRVFQLDLIQRDFSDAYLCHRNQVNQAQTVEAIKNADVLVIAAVERFDYSIFDTAIQIINILSQE